jgi:UDP-N-acetylmuramate dehydrogenase
VSAPGDLSERIAEAASVLGATCGDRLRSGFPLAALTSFRIGGPAALFLEAESDRDLEAVSEAVTRTGIPWTVIGKGSNVLVADAGFAGLVLRLGKGFRWAARDGTLLQAGGSMPLPALAGVALAHSLAGLEFGVAIPASLGGAVRMNAGAHERSMQEVVERIEMYSVTEAARSTVSARRAGFRYRGSSLGEGSVVVGATLALRAGEASRIRAGMEEARAWRRATQPLAEPNCRSVFTNPPGDHAARLVEAVGGKGMTVGMARVSEKHSNFIVADPGATAEDVRRLMRSLQERVERQFGVALEPEVRFVGDFDLASL